jgi:hypothetical protein
VSGTSTAVKPALKSLVSLNPVQAIERNLIGSLSEFDYQDASINTTNIAGDKKIFLDVTLTDGTVERLFCSTRVSNALRNKEMKVSDLFGLPMSIATRENGSKFYRIEMPSGESNSHSIGKVNATTYVPKKTVTDWRTVVAL